MTGHSKIINEAKLLSLNTFLKSLVQKVIHKISSKIDLHNFDKKYYHRFKLSVKNKLQVFSFKMYCLRR